MATSRSLLLRSQTLKTLLNRHLSTAAVSGQSHHNHHQRNHEFLSPSDYPNSWKKPQNPKEAQAHLAYLRRDYDKKVKEVRKVYIQEMELQRLEKKRKDDAKKEALRIANEERKAAKTAAKIVKAAEREVAQLEFRKTLEFFSIKHVGVQSIGPKFQDGIKAFSSSSVIGKIHGASRSLLGHNIGSPSLVRWKSTKTEIADCKPLRAFAIGHGKSAGRNSQGRITSFHRGGGAKRLQRRIDLKRSTSAMGIVERIEYDPNRSSRIALVRWEKGVELNRQRNCKSIDNLIPPRKTLEPTTTTLKPFSFSSLPGKVDQRKVVSFSPGKMTSSVVVGLPNSTIISKRSESKTSSAKDIFFSTLSSSKGNNASISFTNPIGLPKIAVAGAKPAFVASRMKEEGRGENGFLPCEIRKLEKNGILRAHKINRKAAVSWSSLGKEEKLRLARVTEHASEGVNDGMRKDERAPVSYIIASHRMGPGQMVMNCDWSSNPSKI